MENPAGIEWIVIDQLRGIGQCVIYGDYNTIERSIKQRLYSLDEEATVVTGHGPDTRLGDEMRENPFVRA